MYKDKKGKEVDVMATIKPIQATPELSGKDAMALLSQMNKTSKEAGKKNNLLRNVLTSIRK